MKHDKYFVRERSAWTESPAIVKEFYSRRAAEAFVKSSKAGDSLYIEKESVPAYVPHCGSPGVGDPELAKRAKGEDSTVSGTDEWGNPRKEVLGKDIEAVIRGISDNADSEPDGEAFTFLQNPQYRHVSYTMVLGVGPRKIPDTYPYALKCIREVTRDKS